MELLPKCGLKRELSVGGNELNLGNWLFADNEVDIGLSVRLEVTGDPGGVLLISEESNTFLSKYPL
jgi:hypothetical protein